MTEGDRAEHVPSPKRLDRRDLLVAALLGAAGAAAYALSFHPDWIYDPLRYAELMERGPVGVLLGPQHALGNLLPLAAFRAARGLGYGGGAVPVLAGFSVTATGVAVGTVYLAAVRLGGTRAAAGCAAGAFAVTAMVWRSGGSGGVYGVALAALAAGWVVAARYVRRPGTGAAAALGVAAGIAVGSHLANVAFVAAALVLVLATRPAAGRPRALVAFAGATVVTVAVIVGVTAGVAAGWSIEATRHRLLHPGIGGATDRSSQVGWGIGGLFPSVAESQPRVSWLPFGLDQANGHLQNLVVVVLLTVAAARGLMLALRSGAGARLAAALTVNAGLAFVLASWYQALRPDYWGLGLVPLAVMAGAGTRVLGRRRALLRAVGIGAAVAVIGSLMAWNASQYVAPSIELSRARGLVVTRVADRVRPNARLVTSLILAGRLADLGFDAGGGFEALTGEIRAGNPKPGVSGLIAQARRRPLYVSSSAFALVPNQARFLGVTGSEIWRRLQECCELTPILHTPGLPNDETLYRVRPR